jgi:hypothetical protein
MGKIVICGGKARYTDHETVFFPQSVEDYEKMVEQFLDSSGLQTAPSQYQKNARRFMYYQLFKASIPFAEFLENHTQPGYVRLKPMNWRQLKTENSLPMKTLVDGIIREKSFLMKDMVQDD